MEERFLDKTLSKYRWQPHHFSGKEECYALTTLTKYKRESYDEECLLIEKDEIPSPAALKKARLLYLDETLDEFPNYIRKMTNLEFLRVKLDHVWLLTKSSLPDSIRFLAIWNDKDKIDIKNRTFPQIRLPNVLALSIINSVFVKPPNRIDGRLAITSDHFPGLEYLRCTLDDKARAGELIRSFSGFLHLMVGAVDKVDIFEFIRSKLQSLHIEGAGKGFEIAKMAALPSIEMVRFNSVHNTVNCEDFLKMPHLKEIFILNSGKVINTEALLEMRSLKSLELLNCKGALNKEQKDKFKARGDFEYLRIDYA